MDCLLHVGCDIISGFGDCFVLAFGLMCDCVMILIGIMLDMRLIRIGLGSRFQASLSHSRNIPAQNVLLSMEIPTLVPVKVSSWRELSRDTQCSLYSSTSDPTPNVVIPICQTGMTNSFLEALERSRPFPIAFHIVTSANCASICHYPSGYLVVWMIITCRLP